MLLRVHCVSSTGLHSLYVYFTGSEVYMNDEIIAQLTDPESTASSLDE